MSHSSTIIHLGKSFGLEVFAEGVENKQQVEFLAKASCHKIQGYYFLKPVPVEVLEQKFFMKE
jgi:EAL domain-containing protein (putative c-di-GMP-specific phosphodiesterase class I)